MGDPEEQKRRKRAATVIRAAQAVAGGRESLARQLGVPAHAIGEWAAGIGEPPDEVFNRALEVVLSRYEEPRQH